MAMRALRGILNLYHMTFTYEVIILWASPSSTLNSQKDYRMSLNSQILIKSELKEKGSHFFSLATLSLLLSDDLLGFVS